MVVDCCRFTKWENSEWDPFFAFASFLGRATWHICRHDKDCEKAATVNMHPSERACAASHLDLWKR